MEEENKVKASPAIRRIAKQYNIDLNEIVGTGEGGRIEAENLESYLLSKRHMSFAQMSEPEKEEEYASYMPKSDNEKAPAKFNYDEEDYGLSFIGDDIEVEIYPTECENTPSFSKEDELNIKNDFAKLFSFDEETLAKEDSASDEGETETDETEGLNSVENSTDSQITEDLNPPKDEDSDFEVSKEESCECDECADECDDECVDECDDECGCGCEHHHEHHHEHSLYEDEKCQPIAISFTVNKDKVDDLIEETKKASEDDSLLINTVVKALALAIYDEDNEFDGRINIVKFTKEGIEVKTALNALYSRIDDISYDEPFNHEDVFVNVWDLCEFGFTKFARPDSGMVNVFVNKNKRKIIIDSVSDEYCVCIDTCAFMMKSLKENLSNPFVMNERIISQDDKIEDYDDDYDEDYDE